MDPLLSELEVAVDEAMSPASGLVWGPVPVWGPASSPRRDELDAHHGADGSYRPTPEEIAALRRANGLADPE